MKKRVLPSADHMGQACLASAGRRRWYLPDSGDGLEPELGLVDVGVAVAPPLGAADAFGDEGEVLAVGRGSAFELVEVALATDFERGAAGGADAEDVALAGDVVDGGGEVEPFAVGGPGVERFGGVGVGEAGELAGGEGEDVDVAHAGAGGDEGEAGAIGGVEGPRLGGGMGDEEVGFAAGGGYGPDVAAGDEGDLAAIGGDGGLAERREGGLGEGGCGDQEGGREGKGETELRR